VGDEFVDEAVARFCCANERGRRGDRLQHLGHGSLVEDDHWHAALREFARDVALQVREADDEVGSKFDDPLEVGVEKRTHRGLLLCLGRPECEASDTDDTVAQAEPVQRLGGLLGDGHNPLRRSGGLRKECVDDVHLIDVYPRMPLNQSLVGTTYGPFAPFVVTAELARAWAAATDAAGLPPAVPGDVLPMMAVSFAAPVIGAVMFDPLLGVDLMRLLHGEQDMRFGARVDVGDVITTSGTLQSTSNTSSGEQLVLQVRSVNQRGDVVVDSTTSLVMRGSRMRDAHDAERAEREAEAASFAALPAQSEGGFTADVVVDEGMPQRYANASNDHNPIHLDVDVARQAGFPGCTLQNLCVMALVYRAAAAVGPVRRLAVRFNRPVLVGDHLQIEARRDGEAWQLQVKNQANIDVLVGCRVER
jgi:acyl dehydratase